MTAVQDNDTQTTQQPDGQQHDGQQRGGADGGWQRLAPERVRARVAEFAAESGFSHYRRNLFDEGPHLTSSSALPFGDEVRGLVHEAITAFQHGEAWHTGRGGRLMEAEVIRWMGTLLGAPSAAGAITSGGTESNLVALATAKAAAFLRTAPDLAEFTPHAVADYLPVFDRLAAFHRRPASVVLPAHAHYSFLKGCALLGLDPIVVPPTPGTAAGVDPEAVGAAIREDTILVVGTAGTWPYGGLDPIAEMGAVAEAAGVPMHVDGCFGGFILPFLDRGGYYQRTLGHPLPAWDFRVPAVQTISADAHKNGMVPPPASTLYWRNRQLRAVAQLFLPPDGVIAGTRPVSPMAAVWTMLAALGTDGFIQVAEHSMRLRDELLTGLAEGFDELYVVPGSVMNLITLGSRRIDLRPVIDALSTRHWQVVTHEAPAPVGLCVCTMPQNDGQIPAFLTDLRWAIDTAGVPIGALPDDYVATPYGLDLDVTADTTTSAGGAGAGPVGSDAAGRS